MQAHSKHDDTKYQRCKIGVLESSNGADIRQAFRKLCDRDIGHILQQIYEFNPFLWVQDLRGSYDRDIEMEPCLLFIFDVLLLGFLLQWPYNEWDGVSNHQRLDCLLNELFGRRSKKTSE